MQTQALNDVLVNEGTIIPEVYEIIKEVVNGVEIRVTNDLMKKPVFNDKGKPIIRYIFQGITTQFERYRKEKDVYKKYYYFMKSIYLMSKYASYQEFAAAQGESPKYEALWNTNQEAYSKISEIVEQVIDINNSDSEYKQYEFDDARIQSIYDKSDYEAEEIKYEQTLINVQNTAADYVIYMYSNFYADDDQVHMILSNERTYVISQINDYLGIYPHLDSLKNIAAMLVGSDDLNEMYAFESKIKYEVDKYDMCNNHGITPKSYDAFMTKVQQDMDKYFREHPDTDIHNNEIMDEVKMKIYNENKPLLLKVPNFEEEYKSQNKIIYTSAFLIKYINAEMRFEEEIKDSSNHTDPRTKTSLMKMYESLLDYQNKRFERILSEDEVVEINNTSEKQISQEVKTKQNDIEKILAERKRLKEEKKKKKENAAKTPKLDTFVENSSENSVKANLEHSRGVSEGFSEVPQNKKEIEKEENLVVDDKPNTEFEKYSEMKYTKANPKLLRDTNIPLSIRRIKYLESSRYSRSIYLPNSGYRVHVHKLKDEPKLTHMIDLINNIYTAEANYLVKYELLGIVYDSLSFDDFTVEPSFEEFLDNLHDSDLTVLFAMFGLVNAPDSFKLNGDINFSINNVHCKECGTTLYFKHPITLNLKNEFLKLYDKTTFSNDFPIYRSSLPLASVKDAYEKKLGKKYNIMVDDYISELSYNIEYRLPTVAIKLEIERTKYSLSYEIFKKMLSDQITANITVQPEDMDVYNYIKDKGYNSIVDRYQELNKIDYNDEVYSSLTGDNLNDFKKLKNEYNLNTKLFDSINAITNRLNRLHTLMNYISNISVFMKDSDNNESTTLLETIGNDNLLGVIECLTNLEDASLQKFINAVDELNTSNKYNQDLEIEPERLNGRLEWDKYFQTDESGNVISEEEFLSNLQKDNPNLDYEMIRSIRSERKANLEKGYCVCGHAPLIVNYTQLLFFCLSKN